MRFQQDAPKPTDVLQALWPVDSIYLSAGDVNPADLFGFGTWVAFGAGRMLVGIDAAQAEFDALLETGGAKTVTLTAAQMPSHTHVQNAHSHVQQVNSATTGALSGYTPDTSSSGPVASGYSTATATAVNQSTGGDGAHPNLPPYLVVRMWRRTA